MADLPRHPERVDDPDGAAAGRTAAKKPWLAYAVGISVGALVLLMVVLHLTGAAGPGSH